MKDIFLVGLGGGIGAILRYLLSLVSIKLEFPLMTFITNIVGAIFIGIIVGIFERNQISESFLLFFKTGVCGGFTTFSTFSLESLSLLEDKKYGVASVYIGLSVLCCILGVMIGKYISRYI